MDPEKLKDIYEEEGITNSDLQESITQLENTKYKLALVRVSNVIPTNETILPISEVPYLTKSYSGANMFINSLESLLSESGVIPPLLDFSEEGFEKHAKEQERILAEYSPYTSDYNSTLLFSINGIVPDDMNNTFSDKTCAIIEPLMSQINKGNCVSIVPTDTAFKGPMQLSSDAVILIEENRYENLSEEDKMKLKNLNLTVETFKGKIKEAIKSKLEERGYVAEDLSLSAEHDYNISKETREAIDDIAEKKNIGKVLYFNVLDRRTSDVDKLDKVKDEADNLFNVKEYYQDEFYKYLFSKLPIKEFEGESGEIFTKEELEYEVMHYKTAKSYTDMLCSGIKKMGLDKYKDIVTTYNKKLEALRDSGKLPTPQQIIDSINQKKPIDLVEMLEKETEISK